MDRKRISNSSTGKGAVAALVTGLWIAALGCSPAAPPEQAEDTAGAETTPAEPPAPEPEWKQNLHKAHPTVEAWAAAWADQDVDGYLSHYSPDFEVPGGLSREDWEAQRRQRLTAPSRISVTLDDLRTTGFNTSWLSGKKHQLVSVRFRQGYASNTYADEVTKVLQLEWLDGGWKIVTETTL